MFLKLHWLIVLVLADIRMEKLIKLLNEYSSLNRVNFLEWIFFHDVDKDVPHLHYTMIISKEYWFIKWLVDNKKINFKKLEDEWDWYDINTGSDYLDMLALLAIQDKPIEYLVNILK